jgi:hypothetical protein
MSHRILGIIGMICAPMLAASLYARGEESPGMASAGLGLLYLLGWLCSAIGLRELRVTGRGWGGLAVLLIQAIGLLMAGVFAIVEPGLASRDNLSDFLRLADFAWPASHLFMIVVAIAIVVVRRWRGWKLWPAFVCGLALPVALAMPGSAAMFAVFSILTTVGFASLGYAVWRGVD